MYGKDISSWFALERNRLNHMRIVGFVIIGIIVVSPLFSQFGASSSLERKSISQPIVEKDLIEKITYLTSYEPHDRISISDDLDSK